MYELRRRINALRRKLAIPLAVVRLRRLAQEFCIESNIARSERQPQPKSHPFIKRVADAGFRLPTFLAVHKYLERCRTQNTLPDPNGLVHALLPRSANFGTFYDPAGL